MLNKICLFFPYFGKFNNYFKLWLNSARENTKIDFYIISTENNKKYVNPSNNIYFIESSLEFLKNRFSNILGFPCSLDKPYKLCDYKPLYYLLFPEILNKYEYWGFGDVDLIYGDLNSFISTIYQYDVLLEFGHLAFIKNNRFINNIIFDYVPKSILKNVFTCSKVCYFDERNFSRINLIKSKKLNYLFFEGANIIADIYSYSPKLKLVKDYKTNRNLLFHYKKGKLNSIEICGNEIREQSFLYIHLQKRKMINKVKLVDDYYINGYSFFNHKNFLSRNNINKFTNRCLISKIYIFFKLRLPARLNH